MWEIAVGEKVCARVNASYGRGRWGGSFRSPHADASDREVKEIALCVNYH